MFGPIEMNLPRPPTLLPVDVPPGIYGFNLLAGQWQLVPSSSTVGANAPTNPNIGELWFDTSGEGTLRVWNGAQWSLASAIPAGPQGPAGPDGPAGTAATIAIGSTITGPAGSFARVTNTGTPSSAVFNFTIPQGVPGPPGTGGGAPTGIAVGNVAPFPAVAGMLWWDTVGAQLYVNNGAAWVIAVNSGGGGGGTNISLPLSLAQGGTGAISAAMARSNLGAAPIMGVTNGVNAPAGQVGEVIWNENYSPTNGTIVTSSAGGGPNTGYVAPTSITLTPGDWDVSAIAVCDGKQSLTTVTATVHGAISTSPQGPVQDPDLIWPIGWVYQEMSLAFQSISFSVGTEQRNITSPTTLYLIVALAQGPPSAPGPDVGKPMSAYGYIYARRMR